MDVLSGVPQGLILGPMLFLLIFNDMTDAIRHSKVIKPFFRQLVKMYIHIISTKLTDDLKNLSEWLTTNELIINLNKGKTETLLFGTPQKNSKNIPYSCCKNIELCVSRRKN